ncbi:MAG: hypothetical protein AB1749_16730 [Pseudomonadota bacterium]
MPGKHIRSAVRGAALMVALFALLAGSATPAAANWLTKLAREAGEAGGRGGKLGLGALDNPAAFVRALPPAEKGVALAAHATPEGHWRFVDRDGAVFTAATPDEMGRVVQALAPEAGPESRLALYLSEDAVLAGRAHLDSLPHNADLNVVVGRQAYPLKRSTSDGGNRLYATIKPNVVAEITDKAAFEEALWQLARPLNKADVRVVALEPGGPQTLASVPRRDPATGRALVDAVDPYKLGKALGALRGQTVLVGGRIEGRFLHFQPASGPERTLVVADLTKAAEAADVNLVILQSATARQPGGRNWLWQRIEVDGLEDALQRATFADFLDALGRRRGKLAVSAEPDGLSRVVVRAEPAGAPAEPVSGKVAAWTDEIVSQVTGNVVTNAIEAHALSKERREELDARIVPGIPAAIQYGYIGALILGLIGLPVARGWWARVWPPERREEYAGALGYHAARLVKGVAMVLLFLPLVALPAFVVMLARQVWALVTAPVRFLRWLVGRIRGPQAAA